MFDVENRHKKALLLFGTKMELVPNRESRFFSAVNENIRTSSDETDIGMLQLLQC